MKKLKLSLTLTTALILAACGGAGDSSAEVPVDMEDDGEELVVFDGFGIKAPAATTDWKDMDFMNELADNVNVEINWTNPTAQAAGEQINLMFASNDLPDFFWSAWTLGGNDLVEYGANGQLLPLEDLIDEHAPNIKAFFDARPEVRSQMTAPDGHIYAVPQYDNRPFASISDTMFINTDWLDQVGLDMPETTEEFKEVLIAFKDVDLNGNGDASDEIPFSFVLNNHIRGMHSLAGSFGVLGRFIGVEDGEVFFAPAKDEYRDFLDYLNELYVAGVLDPEAFTHDYAVFDSKIQSGEPILGAYFSWSATGDHGTTEGAYQPVPALVGPDGHQGWSNSGDATISQSGFSITNANPNPVRAIKWADQFFDEDISIQTVKGPLDYATELVDDVYVQLDAPEGMAMGEFTHKESPGSYGVYALLAETYDRIELNADDIEKQEHLDMYGPYMPEEYYPVLMYSAEDVDRLSVLESDVNDYTNQMIAEFVMNGHTDEDWDAFIAQLDTIGLFEMLEIYQANYNAYLEGLE